MVRSPIRTFPMGPVRKEPGGRKGSSGEPGGRGWRESSRSYYTLCLLLLMMMMLQLLLLVAQRHR